MSDWLWIAGMIAVESVLQARSRTVQVIYTTHDRFDSRLARINRLAREQSVAVEAHDATTLSAVTGDGHGGIVAQVGPRTLSSLDDLAQGDAPVLFMLDGVEDPFNFGQAVRSLYAAGIDGLVVRRRNWLTAGAAVRAPAGGTEVRPAAEAQSPGGGAGGITAGGLPRAAPARGGQPT